MYPVSIHVSRDLTLWRDLTKYKIAALSAIAKAIIVIVFSRYLAAAAPFVVMVLYLLQAFYLRTSRQIRLLEIEAKAPLYTHFMETIDGAITLRAHGWQSRYQERNNGFIDLSQRPAYLQYCIQSWLGFTLDIIVTIIAALLVTVVIVWRDQFSAGDIGVSLVAVMTFSSVLMRMIKAWTLMESSIGAVARVKRFVAETESESNSHSGIQVPENWPSRGMVEFESLTATYSPANGPVLKDVTFTIEPMEHVALCGRSGSGKTVSAGVFTYQ